MTTLQINGVYNFETLAPAVLGAEFKNAKVLAIMSFSTASKETDIPALHFNVRPFLPNTVSSDFTSYTYVQLVSETNAKTILALEWIRANSIVQVSRRTVKFSVDINDSADIPRILNAIIQNGFPTVSVAE